MIFDELWRAERKARKAKKRLSEQYHPLIEAAKKEKNDEKYEGILSEFIFESDLIDEPESIRTSRLVKRARKLVKSVLAFRDERDWAQFHTAKNLAAAIAIEASELQEAMLWKSRKEVRAKGSPSCFPSSLDGETLMESYRWSRSGLGMNFSSR